MSYKHNLLTEVLVIFFLDRGALKIAVSAFGICFTLKSHQILFLHTYIPKMAKNEDKPYSTCPIALTKPETISGTLSVTTFSSITIYI